MSQITLAVQPEQVESNILDRHLFLHEQVPLTTTEPLLKFSKRQRLITAHGQDFAIQNEVAWNAPGSVSQIEEGGRDILQVTGIQNHPVPYFVHLATDAIIFIFEPNR